MYFLSLIKILPTTRYNRKVYEGYNKNARSKFKFSFCVSPQRRNFFSHFSTFGAWMTQI